MGVQCARKRHRLETEHEKLAAVVGGANTRVNWGLDNPKFSGRGTGARFFRFPLVRPCMVQFHETYILSSCFRPELVGLQVKEHTKRHAVVF